ncbi:ribulose 1,5-bisphosphate carboxylase [Candidatus Bathyarchaeota archaeon]|nr:ribulose 1,5-bisphosphate carboxylase [Candidatus Bathyarchaeota archaeon]MBS7612637.1 ribulose 1,5-bisphosphate carboxylase [Candidatus Bathyarchaeota archaeon]
MSIGKEWFEEEFWIKTFTAGVEEIDPDRYVTCTYYITPKEGLSLQGAAINLAAEQSIGTWTKVVTMTDRVLKLAGKVFHVEKLNGGGLVQVAFPLDLFDLEAGISHILSIVAGNLFGIGALKSVRLLDVNLPKQYVKMFKGPKFGIDGVRKIIGTARNPRPHLGTIIKPKVGLNPDETAKVAYEAAIGGVDFIKDDETLTSQKFNRLEERVSHVMDVLDKVKEETGRTVLYAVDVTADLNMLWKNVEAALNNGANCIMIDVLCTGYPALRMLAEDPSVKVPIHVHRCLHAAMTRNPDHGIHMFVLAKLVRLAGGDQLHTGTAKGKMEKPGSGALRPLEKFSGIVGIRYMNDFLRSDWYGLKSVLPVASGGLHPALVPANLQLLGFPDIQLNAGGGIHGHPKGSRIGATAMLQAVEAFMKSIPLEEYAKEHVELREALEYWGAKFLSEE